jgi:hypothetical protein
MIAKIVNLPRNIYFLNTFIEIYVFFESKNVYFFQDTINKNNIFSHLLINTIDT